jgi:alpha-tubulin suppressor-like RCC1 family protein
MLRLLRPLLLSLIALLALPAFAAAAPLVGAVSQAPAGTLHVTGAGFSGARVLTVRTSGGTFRIYNPQGSRSADNPPAAAVVWSASAIDVTADPRLPGKLIIFADVDGSRVTANPTFYMEAAGLVVSAPGADGTIEISAFSGLSGLPYLILHTDAGDLVFANPRSAQGGHSGVFTWSDTLIRITAADLNGATVSSVVLSTSRTDVGEVQSADGVVVPPLPAPKAQMTSVAISRAVPGDPLHVHIEGHNLLNAGSVAISVGTVPALYRPGSGGYDQSTSKTWTDTAIDADITEGYRGLTCDTTVGNVTAYGPDFATAHSALMLNAKPDCSYTHIAAVSNGYGTTCELTVAGAVYCQGSDFTGMLGQGNTTAADSTTPLLVGGLLTGKTITQVSAGGAVACALDSNAHAYCWGGDSSTSVIGDGTVGSFVPPTDITGQGSLTGKTIQKLQAGGSQSCALDTTGTISCWGRGTEGALGNGSTANEAFPTAVTGGAIWADMSVGSNHVCATTTAGQLYCWGSGGNGRLGTGTLSNQNSPALVSGGDLAGKTIAKVAAGAFHTCALDTAGLAYCWGAGAGIGAPSAFNTNALPIAVTRNLPAGVKFTSIDTGVSSSCATASNNQLYCWGDYPGQPFGSDTTVPGQVTGGAFHALGVTSISSVSAGMGGCAISAQGYALCWGPNDTGELGNGSAQQSHIPVYVRVPLT